MTAFRLALPVTARLYLCAQARDKTQACPTRDSSIISGIVFYCNPAQADSAVDLALNKLETS